MFSDKLCVVLTGMIGPPYMVLQALLVFGLNGLAFIVDMRPFSTLFTCRLGDPDMGRLLTY